MPVSAPSSTALPLHGGDIAAAEARWGRPVEGWLDLSTGINPHPYPLPPIPSSLWARLPGAEAEAELIRAAQHRFNAPAAAKIVAAPGSQALIQALPRLRAPGPVAILTPTYAEHGRTWNRAGHTVSLLTDPAAANPAGVLVIVNPNNPTGRCFDPAALAELSARFASAGGLLVIDEAFADPQPEMSLIPTLPAATVVLRSFGKFHGLAGLRLGFAVTTEAELAEGLHRGFGPWAVSGPALAVGAAALDDDAWASASRARLAADQARLIAVLTSAGLELVGGTPLFTLVRHSEAARIWDELGQAGILVRAFEGQPDWLRIGLPADDTEFERLARALA
ncbi:threonine-phosphate decarboxylase CobD [Magnetospirillum molischianum]|uniref:threonine-phosphate decarboxylase n=1 Tax=Magnetospirillum molischianum DSM 120 TaxID=1150626 RepID=H8FX62_MAGML|nr:threonine-phosphate decarboxylase CobD [Magnetospirillum molischianum]CCG42950.1 Putative threonine-phosphate decarboxylase [Magnetospirillum molischianum DSM 120]